jgi:GDP-L-fucose synthase
MLDLTDATQVKHFAKLVCPNWVIVAAGKVGGIVANSTNPVEFGSINVLIAAHCLEVFRKAKLVYLGSACMYPRDCAQPMHPDSIGTGPLEPSSAIYALAKMFGVQLADAYRRQYNCDYISVIPSALYGRYDNFHPVNCHAVPAMLRKYLNPKDNTVKHWGTGKSVRDFLEVTDLAKAIELINYQYKNSKPINVGSGTGYTIKELADVCASATKFTGETVWDSAMPDGQPQKLLDSTEIFKLGWGPSCSLELGITMLVQWIKDNPWCLERRYEEYKDSQYEVNNEKL